jgi:uncharacterized protein (DUF1800 family)
MKFKLTLICILALMLLTACGGGETSGASNLAGQVSSDLSRSANKATHFAASRFLEQASMGPSPESVEQVKALGIEGWINAQLKMPPTLLVTDPKLYDYELNIDKAADRILGDHVKNSNVNLLINAEDQLRVRTNWVLSNFLVVSRKKVLDYGVIEYQNFLQKNAFSQYGELLKALTQVPAMGYYLDNNLNRSTKLNENYGRELMQLFSVGLFQLNLDGTPKRDAGGKLIETYSQKDVIEITRALTGWDWAELDVKRKNANCCNFGKPMVPYSKNHDMGEKTVLGKKIPAGQDAYRDLESVVEILVTHPNTAPFVSLRLIQGMTTSNPSPAYLERVATVFKDTRGNLAKVVTAILTDPEARKADAPGKASSNFGRIKEPLLIFTSGIRGLGCKISPRVPWNLTELASGSQRQFWAPSVFNYFPPNHRTQGTNILAPEQKLLTTEEFSSRASYFTRIFQEESNLNIAGCDVEIFKAAQESSDEKLLELMNNRFFRGALPATVGMSMIEANKNLWNRNTGLRLVGAYLDMAAMSPSYGVSK